MATLPPAVRSYVDGGSGQETTLRANSRAFQLRTLRPRVLSGIGGVDLSTSILGSRASVPFYVAPMAYQSAVHPDAEAATARAAAAEGVLAMYSTLSSLSMEAIAAASPDARRWFQLYLQDDPRLNWALVERAERAGYSAIVLTADVPILGVRDAQMQQGFAMEAQPPMGNGPEVRTPGRPAEFTANRLRHRPGSAHGWPVLDELRQRTELPIVVKGILTAEDARQAVSHGAKALVVSNHGGRQLDGAPATLDVLAEVVAAVGPETEVYLDGGVRRGPDVVMALALGARAVGIGRPVLWALAADGEAGVRRFIALLREELAVTLALVGRAKLTELDPQAVGARWTPLSPESSGP
ncbi:MAG: alpha-hydroxy-acid oxidizing protein [Thermoplasmata archaeon]|nr:alpha-hydroxy-acid oxidizing protein [Thermoplasmata archaeon]